MDLNPHALWLSPLGEGVVGQLAARLAEDPPGWMTTAQLAEALGESPTGRIRGTLTECVERKILWGDQRHGYRLRTAQDPDD
jgi:hypothetical protein